MNPRWLVLAGFLLAGCSSKPQEPAPAAHNAFTDNVDRGIATMNKAQAEVDAENARIKRQNQQAAGVETPQQ